MVSLLDYGATGKPQPVKPSRVQSPSSILTFKQCPRKYFYRYIARLPSKPSIHLIRGSVVHQVLEDFFAKDLSHVPNDIFPETMRVLLQEMFEKEWAKADFSKLGLSDADLAGYHGDTKVMINNFHHYLFDQLSERKKPYAEALTEIKPRTEIKLQSKEHSVMGYADAVHEHDGKTYILDYKTSSRAQLSQEYELQLSIYGMIFQEVSSLPDEVGIFFLKHGQEIKIPMTERMADAAKQEVHAIHKGTQSKDIDDYELRPGPLCKWSTGQCDYYELCFGEKKIDDFVQIGK